MAKTISVEEDTWRELGDMKGAGETYDDVISELIEARQMLNRERLLAETADDDYVPLEDV